MQRRFHQLDVFSAVSLKGNPLAVVHNAQGLSDDTMATFARWTNLSETAFLLPPTLAGADYRVRIFSPQQELPFAGHPTLGSCHAWLVGGGVPRQEGVVVQECGVGLVRILQSATRLAFAAPPLRRTGPLEDGLLARIERSLRIKPGVVLHHQWVDNGPGWCAVMLCTGAQVRELQLPDWAELGNVKLGVVGAQPPGSETQFEVRAFVPGLSANEDPVTGSLNAGLAQWLIGVGLAPPHYVAAQGHALQRDGRVHVNQIGADVWIGGDVVACIEGHVNL